MKSYADAVKRLDNTTKQLDTASKQLDTAVKQLDKAEAERDTEAQLKEQTFEERNKLVESLLASGAMTIEQLSQVTGLSVAEIKTIQFKA